MSLILTTASVAPFRSARTRQYVMCPSTQFEVVYAINPWMDPTQDVDSLRVAAQWQTLRDAYAALGHRVDLLDPITGLPDMVFAANGPEAHREAEASLGRLVVSLELVDPRFYHLDVALGVLEDGGGGTPADIAWFPGAFSPEARRTIRRLFPDALECSRADALAFAMNFVSEGLNVLLPREALGVAASLAACGYRPIPLEFSGFVKAGGSIKCCTAELHR